MRRLGVIALLWALALPAASFASSAWNGRTAPNDPGYVQTDPLGECLSDQWYLSSSIPACTPLARDPEGSAGMFVDRAWRDFTIGRPDVRIAYIEGGINWRQEAARRELAPRAYLNTGELPKPRRSDGSACAQYDCNGDGQVNVDDYRGDQRIRKPYINSGELTPEDLIVAFSDRRDGDSNGYVDDISGWNFSRGNNDPQTEDSAYGHANNQMRRAAAEADNGYGEAGICPRCTVIPIKAADETTQRTDRLAQSVYFATDSGASVIVALAADLGYSHLMRSALEYAWRHGVVVVGASNDFDQTDHQEGMFWPRTWPGNGLQPDGGGATALARARTTQRFTQRSNITSYGTHALFSVPNSGGSTSESTPTQAGVAALVASWGRTASDRGIIKGRLDAGEIKQVLRETALNLSDPSLGWPGKPGATFNIQYGYGRPNVWKAMRAVQANRIPPVPDILAPDWYALYDPTRQAKVPILADISARRAKRVSYVVEYGLGPQPTEREFHVLARRTITGRHIRGTLARLDLSDIPQRLWRSRLRFTHDLSSTEQHTVTLRVRATDERGNMGEDRRAIAVFHDPDLLPGFPRRLGLGKDSQPAIADVNGDGSLDLVFGDSDGYVHALGRDNRELPGWPAHTRRLGLGLGRTPAGRAHAVPIAYEPAAPPVAVGDLDGDGALEVSVVSSSGRLYVFDHRGRLRRGWPQALGRDVRGLSVPPPDEPWARLPSMGAFSPPVLAHLPGSGTKLAVLQAAWDGKLYAFDGHGRAVPGWPVKVELPPALRPGSGYTYRRDYKLIATPTLADLNGDGTPEVVLKGQESGAGPLDFGLPHNEFFVFALWADGNRHAGGPYVPGWPATITGIADYLTGGNDWLTEGAEPASAADVDGDGADEVMQSTFFWVPQLIDGDGTVIRGDLPPLPGLTPQLGPALLALGQRLAGDVERGAALTATPDLDQAVIPTGFLTAGAFARFRGRLAYLAAGSDAHTVLRMALAPGVRALTTNFMRAYDASTGGQLTGFPAPMMGLAFQTSPAVADVSGDGRADVISGGNSSNVAAFTQAGEPVAGWPKFTGGWTLWTPAVGDLDGDGRNEVAATTREGYLFVWRTPGRASSNQAWNWHQDDWHTGRLGTDTRPPLVPRNLRAAARARVCWTAPGDDWGVGTAAAYELRAFTTAPVAEAFSRGRPLAGAPKPAPAGTTQCAPAPRGARWVGVRAVDDAGLVSYPAFVRLSGR